MRGDAVTSEEEALLVRVHDDLRRLADHPAPVVRAGVRLALAEVSQVLNALDLRYELYTHELDP